MAGGRGERPRRAATACPSSLPSPVAPARGRRGSRGMAALLIAAHGVEAPELAAPNLAAPSPRRRPRGGADECPWRGGRRAASERAAPPRASSAPPRCGRAPRGRARCRSGPQARELGAAAGSAPPRCGLAPRGRARRGGAAAAGLGWWSGRRAASLLAGAPLSSLPRRAGRPSPSPAWPACATSPPLLGLRDGGGSHGVRRRGAGHTEVGRDKRSDRGQATTMKKWAREDEGGGVVLAVGSA